MGGSPMREAYPPRRTIHRTPADDLRFWHGFKWGILIVAPFWALLTGLLLWWVLR